MGLRFPAPLRPRAEVSLITKDAFEPHLPLSVVLHVDYRKAPLVVQRFGDIRRLIEQTLDPMVAAYFKNVGQTRTLIELLQDRSEIQRQASVEMREKFARYSLELEEVLIGTPASAGNDGRIEDILTQLRARQIATEQIETYRRQQEAAVEERTLREAEARGQQPGPRGDARDAALAHAERPRGLTPEPGAVGGSFGGGPAGPPAPRRPGSAGLKKGPGPFFSAPR